MPEIGHYPIEVFGHLYSDMGQDATKARQNQWCPFLGRTCTKPRKSEPHIKVGICSLGYKGSFLNHFEPVIICPCRFLESSVFNTIQTIFLPNWQNVAWTKEVSMGVGGSVDYVALKKEPNGNLSDFLCVEFQACGTTGSPYPYVQDLLANGRYINNYTYGMNWANEFSKTMMQQVYKKGQVVTFWGRKIVFVIQDIALKYLHSAVNTSALRKDLNDPIFFLTFKLIWNQEQNRFFLGNSDWVSTDIVGVSQILGGAEQDRYLSDRDFLNNAIKKFNDDGELNV